MPETDKGEETITREPVNAENLVDPSGNYVNLKEGMEYTGVIKHFDKVTNPKDDYNLSKVDYKYEVTFSDGKTLSVNAWKLYGAMKGAFKEAKCDYLDSKVKLTHPARGQYTCTILEKGKSLVKEE